MFLLNTNNLCALQKVSTCGLTTKQNTVLRRKIKIFHLENAKAEHFDLQVFLFPYWGSKWFAKFRANLCTTFGWPENTLLCKLATWRLSSHPKRNTVHRITCSVEVLQPSCCTKCLWQLIVHRAMELQGTDLCRTWQASGMLTPADPGFHTSEEASLINSKHSQTGPRGCFYGYDWM